MGENGQPVFFFPIDQNKEEIILSKGTEKNREKETLWIDTSNTRY